MATQRETGVYPKYRLVWTLVKFGVTDAFSEEWLAVGLFI